VRNITFFILQTTHHQNTCILITLRDNILQVIKGSVELRKLLHDGLWLYHLEWAKDFVIYKYSNFDHIDVVVGSFATSLKTLFPRHKTMALLVLSTLLVFSARDMVTGNGPSPFKAFSHFCCIKTASIFTFHNPKSLSLINFLISHFEPMVLDYLLTLAPRWTPILRIRWKSHQ